MGELSLSPNSFTVISIISIKKMTILDKLGQSRKASVGGNISDKFPNS